MSNGFYDDMELNDMIDSVTIKHVKELYPDYDPGDDYVCFDFEIAKGAFKEHIRLAGYDENEIINAECLAPAFIHRWHYELTGDKQSLERSDIAFNAAEIKREAPND